MPRVTMFLRRPFWREPADRKLQGVEHLGFDEREVVPAPVHVLENVPR
jgi:hypothetical protein